MTSALKARFHSDVVQFPLFVARVACDPGTASMSRRTRRTFLATPEPAVERFTTRSGSHSRTARCSHDRHLSPP
jgi:hypothetical protein